MQNVGGSFLRHSVYSPKFLTSGQSHLTKRPHWRRIWTVQSYSPGCANVNPDLTFASLDPPKSTSQTASRSVLRLLQGSRSWQTDRPTDHATPSITIGCICVRSTAMRPKTVGKNSVVDLPHWHDAVTVVCCRDAVDWFMLQIHSEP